MAKSLQNPQPMPHPHCAVCSTRDQNPLCSVDGVHSELTAVLSTSRFKAGQTIFYAGNDPLGLFTIQEGLVKLESLSTDGSAHTLRLMGPGQAFGYRSLFAGEPYRATAIAVEDTRLCFVPKAPLMRLVTENPRIAMNLLKQLSVDLRTAESKWVTQIDKEAGSRVAEALLFLVDHFKDQEWTRREIAEWAGTTPETVIRSLAKFETLGWIRTDGRAFTILDREQLLAKAKGPL